MSETFYNKSFYEIKSDVKNSDGEVVDLNIFTDAVYKITNYAGTDILTKDLGNGIVKSGNEFIITINDSDITDSGQFIHSLIVTTSNGSIEPIFNNTIHIRGV